MLKPILLAAGLAVVCSPAAVAQPRMSLAAAVDLCTERAKRFARVPYGRFADEPPPWQVEQQYRACVYANSHQYPGRMPQYRESILSLFRKNG